VIRRVNIGGEGNDDGYGLAVDSTGAIYVAGESSSVDGRSAPPMRGWATTRFYAKIDPLWTSFVYAGFFGGNGGDAAYSCALDSANNLYIAGRDQFHQPAGDAGRSADYGRRGVDGFITRFDSNGTNAYTTYVAGSTDDLIFSVAVDAAGNVYARPDELDQPAGDRGRVSTDRRRGTDAFCGKVCGRRKPGMAELPGRERR